MYPDSRRFGDSCLLLQCLPGLKQTGLLILKKACPECVLTWNDIDSTVGSWELAGLNLHHPHLEDKKEKKILSVCQKNTKRAVTQVFQKTHGSLVQSFLKTYLL